MNLTDLANISGSDKGTTIGAPPHRYSFIYDLIFHELRARPLNFLELGLAIGGPELGGPVSRTADAPSIKMWLEYFPTAHVFGFDISDFSHIENPRFTFVRGDSGSIDDMQRLAVAAPYYDVIIDDASHASYHQQLAFKTLFPHLAKNGLYIIEDLQWQSPFYEKRLPPVPKTAEFLCNFFMRDKYIENTVLPEALMTRYKSMVQSFGAFPDFVNYHSLASVMLGSFAESLSWFQQAVVSPHFLSHRRRRDRRIAKGIKMIVIRKKT